MESNLSRSRTRKQPRRTMCSPRQPLGDQALTNQVVHLTLHPVDLPDLSPSTRVPQEYPNVPTALLDLIQNRALLHPLSWSALSSSLLDELARLQTSAKDLSNQYQLNPLIPLHLFYPDAYIVDQRIPTNPSCNYNRYTDILPSSRS